MLFFALFAIFLMFISQLAERKTVIITAILRFNLGIGEYCD